MHFQVARQRLQISLARVAGLSRTLLHHQLCLSICPQRRSETVGEAHHHSSSFSLFCVRNVPANVFKVHENELPTRQTIASRTLFGHRVCVRTRNNYENFCAHEKTKYEIAINTHIWIPCSWLTINRKLLFNCSYYGKLSGYVYDNFR